MKILIRKMTFFKYVKQNFIMLQQRGQNCLAGAIIYRAHVSVILLHHVH